MIGPGKYDHLATYAREYSGAESVILIVLGGNNGSSFCVQTVNPELNRQLPTILRSLADSIERDTAS